MESDINDKDTSCSPPISNLVKNSKLLQVFLPTSG